MRKIAYPRCGQRCKGYCSHLRTMSLILGVFAFRTMRQMREMTRLRAKSERNAA